MSIHTIEVVKRVFTGKPLPKDLHKTPQADWVQVDLEEWIDALEDKQEETLN